MPVCMEGPAPGKHRDSGIGFQRRSLWHGISVSAKVLQRNLGTWVCVSERCEEPTQRLWGLMPAKVAGQPSSLEAQAGCPEREALLFCRNSFSATPSTAQMHPLQHTWMTICSTPELTDDES